MKRHPRLEAAARFYRIWRQPEVQKHLADLRAKRPTELDEQWPAIRSYLDGDAGPLRTFVKKHTGAWASSTFVFPALEKKDIGDLDEWEVWEFIKHHKARAQSRVVYQEIQEQAPALCSEIMEHRSRVQRFLSAYEDPTEEVSRASFVARDELQSGHSLTRGKVEWRVEKDNRLSRRPVRGTEPLDSLREILGDPRVLAAYDGVEETLTLEQSIEQAGLTPRQLEILHFWRRDFTAEQIADHFKVARNTIDKHISNIYRKLRRVA